MTDAYLRAAGAELDRWRALPPEQRRGLGPPCVVFDDHVVEAVHGVSVANARARLWAGETDPWASVDAYVAAGVADAVTDPIPERWHVCQAARFLAPDGSIPAPEAGPWGHHWLWYALTKTHGVALESSEARGVRLNGVPWADLPAPDVPEAWADRIAPYRAGVAVAVLRPLEVS